MEIPMIKDGRGLHMKKIEKRNRELIVRYFEDNPNSTKKSCCKYVGVSHVTLNKHLRQIEEKGNE